MMPRTASSLVCGDCMTARAHAMIDGIWEQSRKHSREMEVALHGKDVKKIVRNGRVAAIIGSREGIS
jgi:hypothetical protein